MFTVDQALASIESHVQPGPTESVPLAEALGRVLAQPIDSDIDSPPFDKALMDGFAVRADDLADGTARLTVVEEVTAGQVASKTVASGQAIQIMTGAPMPDGADAVVRVEDTQTENNGDQVLVSIDTQPVTAGQDMIRQATSMRRGDTVMPAGRQLRPRNWGCSPNSANTPSPCIAGCGSECSPPETNWSPSINSPVPGKSATRTRPCLPHRSGPVAVRPSNWASPATPPKTWLSISPQDSTVTSCCSPEASPPADSTSFRHNSKPLVSPKCFTR